MVRLRERERWKMNLVKYANWVTGVGLGLGLLVVLNRLQIPYYLLYPRTTQTTLISSSYDYYLFLAASFSVPWTFARYLNRKSPIAFGAIAAWAISLALAIVNEPFATVILYATVICAAAFRLFRSNVRNEMLREILPPALTIIALVESSSIFYWIHAAVEPYNDFGIVSQQLEANLTFSLYPLAIPMLLLLLFSWLWVPLIPRLSKSKPHLIIRYHPSPKKPDPRMILAALDLLAIIAIIIFFYPYLAGQKWIVGQDTYWRYITPLNGLAGLTPLQAFSTSASHGLYVIFLYLIQLATGLSAPLLVKYAPLALALGTASAALFASLRGGWSFQLAMFSAISTLLWLPTTIGIYVDIQANWLAFCLWMVFLGVYSARSETNTVTYVIQAILSLAILLIHPWTWGVFGTTLLLSAITSRKSNWGPHSIRTLAAAMVLAIPLGTAAFSLSPSLRSDLTNTLRLYVSGPINPASLLTFGDALANTFYNLGPALSPSILLLCLVGAYALTRRRDMTANYLIAWTAAWCFGAILVAPSGINPINPGLNETGLWRMLYISPLPFLLALGLDRFVGILKRSDSPTDPTGTTSQIVSVFPILPIFATGAVLLLIPDANMRLLLVTGTLVTVLIFALRFPKYRWLEALMVSVLVLVLFNAAFRTLYPLVLDPHNIFSSAGSNSGPPVH